MTWAGDKPNNLIEGQIEGGIAQGIGLALMEECKPFKQKTFMTTLFPPLVISQR